MYFHALFIKALFDIGKVTSLNGQYFGEGCKNFVKQAAGVRLSPPY